MDSNRPVTKRLAAMQANSSAGDGNILQHVAPKQDPRRQSSRVAASGKSRSQGGSKKEGEPPLPESQPSKAQKRTAKSVSGRSKKRPKKSLATIFDDSDEDNRNELEVMSDLSDHDSNPFVDDEAEEDDDDGQEEDEEEEEDGIDEEEQAGVPSTAVASPTPRHSASTVSPQPAVATNVIAELSNTNLQGMLLRLLSVPGAIEAITGTPFTTTPSLLPPTSNPSAGAAPSTLTAPASSPAVSSAANAGFASATQASNTKAATTGNSALPVQGAKAPVDTTPSQDAKAPVNATPSGPTPPSVAPSGVGQQHVFYEDIHPSDDPFSEPATCEVYREELDDPGLADIHAKDRPRREITVVGFNGHPANNFFCPMDWATKAPELDLKALRSALEFVSHGAYVNLARISPRILAATPTPSSRSASSKNRRILSVGKDAAVALTAVYVTESHLNAAPAPRPGSRGTTVKNLAGLLHGLEYDRIMSCAGMAFRQKEMYHNLFYSSVQFSTVPPATEGNGTPRRRSQRSFYQGSSAPSSPNLSTQKTYLLTTETVPVYDASNYLATQGRSLDLAACIGAVAGLSGEAFDNAMKSMGIDRTDSEAEGACAVVAHTVNLSEYQPKDAKAGHVLNFNVLWVLILGWDNVQSETEK